MPFNFDAAKQDGISDEAIQSHLQSLYPDFNVANAIQDGVSLRQISDHLTKQGGDKQYAKQNQPQANLEGNAPREGDQQGQPSSEAGIRTEQVRLPKPQGKEQRVGDINASGQVKGGELSSEEEDAKTEGQRTQEGGQDGQGLRGQVPSGNQAEVTAGGVRPPKGYVERLVSKAKEKPAEAAKVAGSAVVETGAGLAGGTIAAALAAPAAAAITAGTGGLATPLAAGLEMAAFAAGSYVGTKAEKLIESAIGIDKDIEKAQKSQEELSQASSIATMVPMGIKSVANLAKLTGKEAAKRVAGGAVGGAAFEPIRYGVESGIQYATGSEDGVAPVTLESVGESALIGAALSGMGARKIAKDVGPETAKVAATQLTDDAIAEKFKAEEIPVDDHIKSAVEAGIPDEAASYFVNKQKEAGLNDEQIAARIAEFKDLNEKIDASRKAKEPVKAEELVAEESTPAEPAIEAPEGARIASAAYTAPDGTTYTGKSHVKAMEAARDDGKITQKEIDAKEEPVSRNTEEFGYEITLPDGTRKTVTREEGAAVARASGQAQEEPFTFGEKMHSNETAKDDHPDPRGIAESIHHGDVFQYGKDKVKLVALQDDGVVARKLGTNEELLLPKGTEGGHPKGIEGLELVKLAQEKKAPMSPKTMEALRLHLNDRLNPETNSILRRRKSEGGFIDLTALKPYLENIHDYGRAVYKKGMDFATWSARMIKDLGQGVVSALKKVYDTISQGPYIKGKSFAGSIGSAGDEFAKRVEGKMKAKAPEGEPPPQEYYPTEPSWKQYENLPETAKKTAEVIKTDVSARAKETIKDPEVKSAVESAFTEGVKLSEPKKESAFRKGLRKLDMFTNDMKILGAKVPKLENIHSGYEDATQTIADAWDGRTIPNLSRVGVKPQAVQLANATKWVESRVNTLLAEVFPDSYQNEARMAETMDILAKDDIRGGYKATIDELNKVNEEISKLMDEYDAGIAPRGVAGRIKELQEKADDLMDSRDAISKAHDLEKYKKDVESAKGTQIEEDINRWKKIIHPVQDEFHSKWGDENVIPIENAGETFGARINFLSKDQELKIKDFHEDSEKEGKLPSVQVVNYRNPDVKGMRLGDRSNQYNSQYSTDAFNILKNTFAPRVNDASKIDLYNALIKSGAAVIKKPDATAPTFNGKEGRKFPVRVPVKNQTTGKTSIIERDMWVDPKIHDELMQLLDVNGRIKPLKIFSAVTQLQVLGIADGVAHLKNLHGAVNNSLSGDPALKQIAKKIPFISSINTISKIRSVMREIELDSPAIRKEISELAMTAGLRSKYDQTGLAKYVSMHNLLHNVDTAARVIMSRNYDALVKKGLAINTPEAKIDFVNQIGEYNRKLMSRWQAVARDSGFSPFIVAGRAMNRLARRLVLADPGFEATSKKAAIEARVLQGSGLVLAATIPALINMITTGSIGGRYGTPVGAIDFGPNADTKEGKRRILDLFALTGIRRGMRLLGLNAAIEGVKNGASLEEIQNNMKNDFTTTSLHPFIGPGVSLAWQTLKGERFDLRTGFQGVYSARQIGGYAQYLENLRVGLKQQQPLLYSAGGGALLEKAQSMVKTKEYPKGIPAPSEETKSDIEYPSWIKPIAKPFETAAEVVASSVGYKATVSPALKLSAQLGIKLPYTPQQDIRYAIRKSILKAVKEGEKEKAKQIFQQGLKDGTLVKADITTLSGKLKEPDLLVQRVKKLKTPQDALEVYKVASPEEQDTIINEVFGKILRSNSVTPERKRSLKDEMLASTKSGSKAHKTLTSKGVIPVAKKK